MSSSGPPSPQSSLPTSSPNRAARGNDTLNDEPFPDETEDIFREDQLNADVEEEEEGEDLMDENAMEDYRVIPELDTYDEAMLADKNEEVEELDATERALAEREMRKRDRMVARGRAQGRGRDIFDRFGDGDDDDDNDDDAADDDRDPLAARGARRRARRAADADATGPYDEELDENEVIIENLEDMKGHTLREWVLLDLPHREIRRRFTNFLNSSVDEQGNNIYAEKIKAMCESNGESLYISYADLCQAHPVLAIFVADAPTEMLVIFDEAAKRVVLDQFPHYADIRSDIHVRVSDLPVDDQIRDIRQIHLNALIKVSGVVTRRTGVFPEMKLIKYRCGKCSASIGPFTATAQAPVNITNCPECQSRGPFLVDDEETVYRNYQRITIQESPGSVPAGRLPRHKDVILLWDLVDSVKPGDEVELTGIYRNNFDQGLNIRHGFPVFSTCIEANHIVKRSDKLSTSGLTDEDMAEIRKLAKDDNIGDRIIRSIAPSIYGHKNIKTAMAMSMFAGEAKQLENKMRIRGDINVLVLGDPGTAKSQFLKYVERAVPRAVFTTGQGASAVGLTAAVQRDPLTREWTLQGGALVLADQGICLIDEFDKMNDQDRTSIHEAMEQQTISVSKAGIVTSLQARCAVIAAANPIKGKYQGGLTFAQNVDLTEPIISRFDVLCVVKDTVDPITDERLAEFVVGSHFKNHPYEIADADNVDEESVDDPSLLSQSMLRKYIMYAKQNVHPKLHNIDRDKISTLYSELRKESEMTGSIPITVRVVDSIMRLAEAHAKMHLREYVRDDDVNMAIRVVVSSFIDTQKHSVAKQMSRIFHKYISYRKDDAELLQYILQTITREELSFNTTFKGEEPERLEIDAEEFTLKAKQYDIGDVSDFYQSNFFQSNGYEYDKASNTIIKHL